MGWLEDEGGIDCDVLQRGLAGGEVVVEGDRCGAAGVDGVDDVHVVMDFRGEVVLMNGYAEGGELG